MAHPVLVSSVGWKPHLIGRVVKEVGATHVYLVHTLHEKTLATKTKLQEQLHDVDLEFIPVDPNFDFNAWHDAIEDIVHRVRRSWPKADMAFNLTAGHAITIATLGILADRYQIPCVCWDDDKGVLEHMVPSTLTSLPSLNDLARAILHQLMEGPASVSTIQDATGSAQSTVSTSLTRLRRQGYVFSERRGKQVIYEIRPGVRSVVRDKVHRPTALVK